MAAAVLGLGMLGSGLRAVGELGVFRAPVCAILTVRGGALLSAKRLVDAYGSIWGSCAV